MYSCNIPVTKKKKTSIRAVKREKPSELIRGGEEFDLIECLKMHPPLTLHKHPMCVQIIEEFQKCHLDHPFAKFIGECTALKIKLDLCFRQEKALKRKANCEQSKKLRDRLQASRKEAADTITE